MGSIVLIILLILGIGIILSVIGTVVYFNIRINRRRREFFEHIDRLERTIAAINRLYSEAPPDSIFKK